MLALLQLLLLACVPARTQQFPETLHICQARPRPQLISACSQSPVKAYSRPDGGASTFDGKHSCRPQLHSLSPFPRVHIAHAVGRETQPASHTMAPKLEGQGGASTTAHQQHDAPLEAAG
jgi:hypothetical protein